MTRREKHNQEVARQCAENNNLVTYGQYKTHAEQLALIHEAFNELPEMCFGFRNVADLLLDMNEKSERRHRKASPGGYPGISVTLAAKYFVVHHLLDGYNNPRRYAIDSILNVRNEVLYAQEYAKRFRRELTEWAFKYTQPITELDYSKLVQ